ncbi:ATPase, AAA-type, core [Parasponia andersonii]|uniref:ATPase, AAA-type, core n=1 Tax=Parasponia andersonii TaxID=3476 RepID=A0A2P5C4I9_PARAD|nr:ATPase, AAA-type, core [Parasponia andersonii]
MTSKPMRKPPPGSRRRRRVLPAATPDFECALKLLKLKRMRDYLFLEEQLVSNEWIMYNSMLTEKLSEFDRLIISQGFPSGAMKVAYFDELVDDKHAIVTTSSSDDDDDDDEGDYYYVGICSCVDKDCLYPGCAVLMSPFLDYGLLYPAASCTSDVLSRSRSKVGHIVFIVGDASDTKGVVKNRRAVETFADIVGLDEQIREVKELAELPHTHRYLFEDIGFEPPKGAVLLYGEPGTGKTLLAKGIANSISAKFLPVVCTELIKKELGEGPKILRKLFIVAEQLSPSVVFIDKVDAISTKRYASVSRTAQPKIHWILLELLAQLDFDSRSGVVKVILATSRIDRIDPALLQPGRIDRKISLPLPNKSARRQIFLIHTSKMTLENDVNLEEILIAQDGFSGADIKAICKEASLLALRDRREKVRHADFKEAKEKVMSKKEGRYPEEIYM